MAFQTQRNARFWHFVHGSPVKITLRPNRSLFHSHGGPTDEGWHRESVDWFYDGDVVTEDWCHDGRDCDGRLTRGGTVECPVADLAAGPLDEETGLYLPVWNETKRHQRDYSAEAMGY